MLSLKKNKRNKILESKIVKKLDEKFKVIEKLQVLRNQKYLLLMSLPFIIWVIIFKYIPLWGWTIAFRDYKPGESFSEYKWEGFKYFIEMFQDPIFYNVLRNTLAMSFLQLICGFTLPVILAILLNELRLKYFKNVIQTVSYLPHFVSWVVVASIFHRLLSTDNGVVNQILMTFHLTSDPIQFMAKPKLFWGIVTIADVWKELGWNSIIFFAAIATIPIELYESAYMDGANRFRRIWHITLPCIMPIVMIILIMSIGNLINIGFEKQYLLRTNLVKDYSDVLDLYVLDYGIKYGRWAFGTAVGIFKSVVSIILLLIANGIIKKTMDVKLI